MKFGLLHPSMGGKSILTETIFFPLGPRYIASYIEQHMDIDIIITDDIYEIINFKPDIAGLNAITPNIQKASSIAEQIKEQLHIPIILGGVHITSLPHKLPDSCDIGVIGEGEETTLELMKIFKKNKNFPLEELGKVKGIVYRNNGTIVINSFRETIENLDSLPFPKRDLSDINGFTHMVSSRGCPFRCSFCSASKFWGRYRFFSPEYIVKEIKHLVNDFYVDRITFFDDLFVMDKKRLSSIINLLAREELDKKVKFSGYVRAELFDKEICLLLKEMNFSYVGYGAESGSNRILSKLKENKCSVKDNQKVIDLCKKNGMAVSGSFIIGSPWETEDDLMKTYKFIEKNKNKFQYIEISPLIPYPGTQIWDYARNRHLVSEDMDFTRLTEMTEIDLEKMENIVYLCEKIPFKKFIKYAFYFKELYNYIKDNNNVLQ